jgi:MarR family transcriptional regulator, organic hydroperoxide resistance regulator
MDHMPDKRTLVETERAMTEHVAHLPLNFPAAHAVSSLYRTANAARAHLTNTVLRRYDLTWTGFLVMWTVWIWDGRETRDVAESASISKATLTGVVKTLESHGWIRRLPVDGDRRLVFLELTPEGVALMERIYPEFNAAEAQAVEGMSERALADLTKALRRITTHLEQLQGPTT